MTRKRNILSAVNEGLKNSDIKVLLGVGEDGDWNVKIDTTEHDKQIRKQAVEEYKKALKNCIRRRKLYTQY